MVRYGELDVHYHDDPDTLQRLIEGQHFDTRIFLYGYEVTLEGRRKRIHTLRQEILHSDRPSVRSASRCGPSTICGRTIERTAEYRSAVH